MPTRSSRSAAQQNNLFNTISRTSLLTGILYIVVALVLFYFKTERGAALAISPQQGAVPFLDFLTQGGAAGVFKHIASGAFGTEALTGGMLMVVWGLVFHFMIAFGFTTVLFLLYPILIKRIRNKWLTAALYGLACWIIMTLGILPLSSIRHEPFDAGQAIIDLGVIVVTIALPAVLVAGNYHKKKDGR